MSQNSSPSQTASYAVDVVFCIDCTGSMKTYLESVKATAQTFHQLLETEMSRQGKSIRQLRVRVIAFRDLGHEGPDAIQSTRFFLLPDERDAFHGFVSTLHPAGGGDEAESALEALATAIRSMWERGLDRRRHVIVMCTDASAHPLGLHTMRRDPQDPPMPEDLDQLLLLWGDSVDAGEMELSAKRLLLFAPDAYPWSDVANDWENVIWFPSAAADGLADHEQREIIDQIASSV